MRDAAGFPDVRRSAAGGILQRPAAAGLGAGPWPCGLRAAGCAARRAPDLITVPAPAGPRAGGGRMRPGGAPDPDPFRPEQGTAAFFVPVFLSAAPAAWYVSWYGTYGGGGHYYIITETDPAECDLEPFRPPADCRTGTIRDRCASHGGTWDAAGRECSDISKRSCDLITYEPPIRNGATRCPGHVGTAV